MRRYVVLLALMLPCVDAVAAAHEHGAAILHVAIDGNNVHLSFASPLDNLVGFEHAPRTDKEREAVKRMTQRLREPERLFVTTPEARCVRASAEVGSPKGAGGHASIEAESAFRCERPQALSGIDVKAFEAFPNLKRIDVQVAGAKKQSGAKLTPRSPRIAW
jgi:hypothetical protein